MSPTIDDLRTALDGAAETSATHGAERLDGLRGAIARRRRTRALASGAAGLALVLAGAVAVAGLPLDDRAAVQPAGGELDEYDAGGRLLAESSVPSTVGASATIQFTPTSYGLALRGLCDPRAGTTVALATTVNGMPMGTSSGCGGSSRAGFGKDQQFWQSLGVRLGRPSSVTVTVIPVASFAPRIGDRDSDDPAVSVRFGIYQDVDPADYPLPPRPATVTPPAPGFTGPSATGTSALTPQAPAAVVVWERGLQVRMRATVPGKLTVLVDGMVLGGASFWEYDRSDEHTGATAVFELSEYTFADAGAPAPVNGQRLEVSVRAERFADPAWRVEVGPAP